MDGAPDAGGRNLGFRPMEMMLLGLAGCSAFDVVLILKRGRENVTDCVVDVDGDRADTDPKVFTNVRMHYIVTGRNLDPNKVERAVKLSEEKYCSAACWTRSVGHVRQDGDVDAYGRDSRDEVMR